MAVEFEDARYPGDPAVDEPVILIRASDPAAIHALSAYAKATADLGVSPHGETTSNLATVVGPINDFRDDMAVWRRANGYNVATV
jgi:hypothetical protein